MNLKWTWTYKETWTVWCLNGNPVLHIQVGCVCLVSSWACLGAVSLTMIHLRSCKTASSLQWIPFWWLSPQWGWMISIAMDSFPKRESHQLSSVQNALVFGKPSLSAITCERVQNPISARRVKTKPYGIHAFLCRLSKARTWGASGVIDGYTV
jgi:hypothetical protein